MEDEPDLAVLRQRLVDEVAAAQLYALACHGQNGRCAWQMAEARDLLNDARERLAAACQSREKPDPDNGASARSADI